MPPNISQCCSFCGKAPSGHLGVVQGPGVNICEECVELCRAVLTDERFSSDSDKPRPAFVLWSVRVDIPYETGYEFGLYTTEQLATERAQRPDVRRYDDGHSTVIVESVGVWNTQPPEDKS